MWLATSHLGEKIRKSASGAARSREGAVRTQKMDGSMWSTEVCGVRVNLCHVQGLEIHT